MIFKPVVRRRKKLNWSVSLYAVFCPLRAKSSYYLRKSPLLCISSIWQSQELDPHLHPRQVRCLISPLWLLTAFSAGWIHRLNWKRAWRLHHMTSHGRLKEDPIWGSLSKILPQKENSKSAAQSLLSTHHFTQKMFFFFFFFSCDHWKPLTGHYDTLRRCGKKHTHLYF